MRTAIIGAVAASLLAGCASNAQPTNSPSPSADIYKRLADIWRSCVAQSYPHQRQATPDKSLAIESAFMACQTEETMIRRYGLTQGVSYQRIESIIAMARLHVKKQYMDAP